MITYQENLPSAETYFELFETTGWNQAYQVNMQQISQALSNSWCVISAYDQTQLVAVGRIVSDGVLYAMIYDMIVKPSYQGKGIGSAILHKLIAKCTAAGIRDIQLFSAKGKSSFYQKHGFIQRPDDAPGMRWDNS